MDINIAQFLHERQSTSLEVTQTGTTTPSSALMRAIDPLTASPFAPIDTRIVQIIYKADEGYFLQSFPGFLFFCFQELPQFRAESAKSTLKCNLQCPEHCRAATYAHIYSRWAETNGQSALVLRHLCHETREGVVLRLAVCRALSEARSAHANGLSIGSVKTRLVNRIQAEEPAGDERTKDKWKAACLDDMPSISGFWTYALPVPWEGSHGIGDGGQIRIPDKGIDTVSPPTAHALRYIRPTPNKGELALMLSKKTRAANETLYLELLGRLTSHGQYITAKDIEVPKAVYQPRSRIPVPCLPFRKSTSSSITLWSMNESAGARINAGEGPDRGNTKRKRSVQDEFAVAYEATFRGEDSGFTSDEHLVLMPPPHHRKRHDSMAPFRRFHDDEDDEDDDDQTKPSGPAETKRLTASTYDFLDLLDGEDDVVPRVGSETMDDEEIQARTEMSAEAGHQQCRAELGYETVHLYAKRTKHNWKFVHGAEERVLFSHR